MAKYYEIPWIHHILFIRSPVDGHLGYCLFFAFMTKDAMDTHWQAFVWTDVFTRAISDPSTKQLTQLPVKERQVGRAPGKDGCPTEEETLLPNPSRPPTASETFSKPLNISELHLQNGLTGQPHQPYRFCVLCVNAKWGNEHETVFKCELPHTPKVVFTVWLSLLYQCPHVVDNLDSANS